MTNKYILMFACCVLAQTVSAEWLLTENQKREIDELTKETNIPPQMREQYTMISYIGGGSVAYRANMINKMLEEANYFTDKLNLSTQRPIQIKNIQYPFIAPPWFNVIRRPFNQGGLPDTIFSNRIYDVNIPREARLRALKFGTFGTIETTNFFFSFENGKLWEVERLSEHDVEYYAHDLDKLVGKPSLIDTNGAYQLATQWLSAVEVDMTALNKLKWTVNQLHYLVREATNYVTLPLYYVDFGNKHTPASGNLHAFDEPLVSVEILGTTKELQDLTINDLSFSRRSVLLITNALDLIRTPNLPLMQLQRSPEFQTNALGKP